MRNLLDLEEVDYESRWRVMRIRRRLKAQSQAAENLGTGSPGLVGRTPTAVEACEAILKTPFAESFRELNSQIA